MLLVRFRLFGRSQLGLRCEARDSDDAESVCPDGIYGVGFDASDGDALVW